MREMTSTMIRGDYSPSAVIYEWCRKRNADFINGTGVKGSPHCACCVLTSAAVIRGETNSLYATIIARALLLCDSVDAFILQMCIWIFPFLIAQNDSRLEYVMGGKAIQNTTATG